MRNRLRIAACLVSGSLIVACSPGDPEGAAGNSGSQRETMETARSPARPPAPDDLANATFSGITDEAVTLVDGRWEGEPSQPGAASRTAVQLVRDFHLTGDLDGDGTEESVALLTESSGGSGTRVYLVAAGWSGAGVANLGTAPIGDRVQVKSARIVAGTIEMEVVQAGPEDAMCCPSERASRSWTLGENGLVEGAAEVTGKLSVADLAGPEWVLTHWAWGEPAPAEPEVTLVYEDGRIGGNAGCNGYFAGVADGGMPGDLEVSAAGATRMACPPEITQIEGRFLDALESSEHYSFLAGKLAIGYASGDSMRTLLFSAREPTAD